MPLYKYEVMVDLPDDDAARETIQDIHGAVCGGTSNILEDGTVEHQCARWWAAQVHQFTPVAPTSEVEVEVEGAVEVEWDDESKAVAKADHKMAFEDGLV